MTQQKESPAWFFAWCVAMGFFFVMFAALQSPGALVLALVCGACAAFSATSKTK